MFPSLVTWQAPASKALSRALQATEEEESNIYFSLCGCAEDGSNMVVLADGAVNLRRMWATNTDPESQELDLCATRLEFIFTRTRRVKSWTCAPLALMKL